jgi:hypothetical protein
MKIAVKLAAAALVSLAAAPAFAHSGMGHMSRPVIVAKGANTGPGNNVGGNIGF